MQAIKKIIHSNKDHDAGSTTNSNTPKQHGKVLKGSDTGDNIANPFTEPNTTAASSFLHHQTATGTTAPAVTSEGRHPGQHDDHRTTTTHSAHHTAATGLGRADTTPGSSGPEGYVPGVNTGGAKVVGARMPVEEGNNFPGTNPQPAHDALGTEGGGGLKYAGGE